MLYMFRHKAAIDVFGNDCLIKVRRVSIAALFRYRHFADEILVAEAERDAQTGGNRF